MDGRKAERERCDPHSRASSIYRGKCPNWQAAGRATALHWYPTPCPSPPQPSLLLVAHLLLPLSSLSFIFSSHPSVPCFICSSLFLPHISSSDFQVSLLPLHYPHQSSSALFLLLLPRLWLPCCPRSSCLLRLSLVKLLFFFVSLTHTVG